MADHECLSIGIIIPGLLLYSLQTTVSGCSDENIKVTVAFDVDLVVTSC